MKSILKSAVKAAVVVTGVWAAKKYGVDKKIKHKLEQIKYNHIFAPQTEPAGSSFEEDEDDFDYTDIFEDEE